MPVCQYISNNLKTLGQGFLHLFYPRLCEGCRKPLLQAEEVVCMGCELQLARTAYHHIQPNETGLRLSGRVPFLHATSLAYFTDEGLLQHLIHGLKYKGKEANGVYLGKELGRCILSQQWAIDGIVPVPLHRKKELRRGYNQSVVIATGVSEMLGIPIYNGAVIRKRHTESQTEKTRAQRVENVSDAFELRRPGLLEGKHVLLVDDVLTTGATIEACALAMLQVRGLRVSVGTVGIAGS